MKKILTITSILLSLLLILPSCSDGNEKTEESSVTAAEPETQSFAQNDGDMFTKNDLSLDYDTESAIKISLDGDSVSCSSELVKISGSSATLTAEATYIISGELTDGSIIVDADENAKPRIILDGANITSSSSAALYIRQADKVFLTLADRSENFICSGDKFVSVDENNIDGAIFSKQDLTLNGNGSLSVTSPAGHGIVCKDDLVFTGGNYEISASLHAIEANDSVRITSASLKLVSGKDGIHAENDEDASSGFIYLSSDTKITVFSDGDGISAGAHIQIEEGEFDLLTGGGAENSSKSHSDGFGGFMGGYESSSDEDTVSAKGIKADGGILINGGGFKIDSADDAVHSNSSVTVNGGDFEISSGDDGFHADETLTFTSGRADIKESYEGLEALDIKFLGGEVTLVASDDGLNAAGGVDESGYGGNMGDDMFGGMGRPGGMGGHGGMGGAMGGSGNSDGSIVISGGKLNITASGDGIDANGTLEISGGYTVVCGPTQGDTATLDFDVSAKISGGIFIGTGAQGMAQTFSDSEQGVIAVSVGNSAANTKISIKDKNGNEIVAHTPSLGFAVVIISTPEIEKGEKYAVTVGSMSGDIEAY